MFSKKWLLSIIIVLVILGGFFYLKSSSTPPLPTSQPVIPSLGPAQEKIKNLITISQDSFSPAAITLKAGETVTWKNTDTADHQVNSDPHPTHLNYPPLNTVGLIKPGEEKSLTFPTQGTYGYHDHLNPQLVGSIIVQ